MMEKIQKFGGAMFTPVMLFAVSALLIGFGTLFTTEVIMGPIASEGTIWFGIWGMILSGAWVVFNQLPLYSLLTFIWRKWGYIKLHRSSKGKANYSICNQAFQ